MTYVIYRDIIFMYVYERGIYMKKIDDRFIIKTFYNKFKIDELFEKDMSDDIKLLRFEKNEYLCREGEELEYFLFLVEGKAKVFKTLPNGKSSLLSFYNSLGVIGDLEFINEEVASGTLQALSTCNCLAIPMDIARVKLINDCKFLRFSCLRLAEKLADISTSSSINLLYPLENRLASYINELMIESNSEIEYVDFDESLSGVAENLGSSYRHLLRTLNSLIEKNILDKDKLGYKVIDKNKLADLAGDLYKAVYFE